jgi:hypothetical protein
MKKWMLVAGSLCALSPLFVTTALSQPAVQRGITATRLWARGQNAASQVFAAYQSQPMNGSPERRLVLVLRGFEPDSPQFIRLNGKQIGKAAVDGQGFVHLIFRTGAGKAPFVVAGPAPIVNRGDHLQVGMVRAIFQ